MNDTTPTTTDRDKNHWIRSRMSGKHFRLGSNYCVKRIGCHWYISFKGELLPEHHNLLRKAKAHVEALIADING